MECYGLYLVVASFIKDVVGLYTFKNFIMNKNFLLLISFIGITFYSSAQVAGDYRSIGNGNWNDPSKWEVYDDSAWVGSNSYPGENSGTGTVTIMILHQVELTSIVPHPIASLLVDQRTEYAGEDTVTQVGVLRFSSENPVSLSVSGDVVIHGALLIVDQNGTKTHSLFVGGG